MVDIILAWILLAVIALLLVATYYYWAPFSKEQSYTDQTKALRYIVEKPTELMHAVCNHDLVAVKRLVEKSNKKVNAVTHEGFTAARLAVLHGQLEILKFLVGAGAVLNARSDYPVQDRDWDAMCRQFKLPSTIQTLLQGDKYKKTKEGVTRNLHWFSLPFYAIMAPHFSGLPNDKQGTGAQKLAWGQAQDMMQYLLGKKQKFKDCGHKVAGNSQSLCPLHILTLKGNPASIKSVLSWVDWTRKDLELPYILNKMLFDINLECGAADIPVNETNKSNIVFVLNHIKDQSYYEEQSSMCPGHFSNRLPADWVFTKHKSFYQSLIPGLVAKGFLNLQQQSVEASIERLTPQIFWDIWQPKFEVASTKILEWVVLVYGCFNRVSSHAGIYLPIEIRAKILSFINPIQKGWMIQDENPLRLPELEGPRARIESLKVTCYYDKKCALKVEIPESHCIFPR
ncbi:ankyrin repeat domain-containing protein [Candidatus Comchoanobacter bicostacola]|uniref:Ankyrin repeat domain-containing protein n=1 Tax=Candidatus Comchoanobacter bicostacola TaxID=2919598 RepID=A0ABY5DK34_9GAMM|nr:ankyrin repeat domain-containing protein [Candidatus Comchoanobacter bicostacola]UTC24249.1 ankyrin repeat domain-containing protein [Candidatus Comchoanobacter bicostacola]